MHLSEEVKLLSEEEWVPRLAEEVQLQEQEEVQRVVVEPRQPRDHNLRSR